MHKSRLAGLVIDCQTDDLEQAVEFWSQALGYSVRSSNDPEDEHYMPLATPPNDVYIEVQQVEHSSRVHLDIESDNIEVEVQRLEKLGAKRLKQIRSWWVMEAPTGQRFCVVPPQRSNFDAEANVWED